MQVVYNRGKTQNVLFLTLFGKLRGVFPYLFRVPVISLGNLFLSLAIFISFISFPWYQFSFVCGYTLVLPFCNSWLSCFLSYLSLTLDSWNWVFKKAQSPLCMPSLWPYNHTFFFFFNLWKSVFFQFRPNIQRHSGFEVFAITDCKVLILVCSFSRMLSFLPCQLALSLLVRIGSYAEIPFITFPAF